MDIISADISRKIVKGGLIPIRVTYNLKGDGEQYIICFNSTQLSLVSLSKKVQSILKEYEVVGAERIPYKYESDVLHESWIFVSPKNEG